MYVLSGNEFNNLVTREFTATLESSEASGSLLRVFSCQAKNLRTSGFDMLRFSGTFEQDTRVADFQDTTHVSLHLQLAGSSGASISGLKGEQPMQQGQFNLLNCIEPKSSFSFPKQHHYEYICLGLKPSFFNQILEECGTAYSQLLERSVKKESYTLFDTAQAINQHQLSALRLLQNPPLADDLHASYTNTKVKELVMLSISSNTAKQRTAGSNFLTSADVERLNAVKTYLSSNYLSAQTLEGISRRFLLNEFKLKRGFKQSFGCTVFGYIHQLRMQHALMLIQSGGFQIAEVAMLVGYNSDSSFIRAFKTFHGYTPTKYL